MSDQQKKVHLSIEGMRCASCANSIEKILLALEGVDSAVVNFATSSAYIVYNPENCSFEKIALALQSSGYQASLSKEQKKIKEQNPLFNYWVFSALLTAPLMLQMPGVMLGWHSPLPPWLEVFLATVVQIGVGNSFYRGAFFALKHGRANMDTLIVLGTTAAWSYSFITWFFDLSGHFYFESSAMIITLVLFGRWLEEKAKKGASHAIEKLLLLQPKIARVWKKGEMVQIPVEKVVVGDLLQVLPGESFAVDGVVIEGFSSVDESSLTGESSFVDKTIGNKVYSATVNHTHSLKIQATEIGETTVLANIIKRVEQAQGSKAQAQRLADKISAIFVPVVVFIALLTLMGWWLWEGDFSQGLIPFTAVLVVACPCALGLATPTVIVVATGLGASRGLLFKEAQALENAQNIDCFLLDKTGTLTKGKPSVIEIVVDDNSSKEELIAIAAALEAHALHPIAKAVVAYAEDQNLPIPKACNVQTLGGKGVQGMVNGDLCGVGSVVWMQQKGIFYNHHPHEEGSFIAVWKKQQFLGGIVVSDALKERAKEAVEALKALKIQPVMVTGDNSFVAKKVAEKLNIEKWYSQVLPEEKMTIVEEFQKKGFKVGMVGDGINDAPALAAADVGFSVGVGSDIAHEASDVTLMLSDPMSLIDALLIAKVVGKKIRQNLFLAFAYNSLAIPFAALGWLNPIIAAALMAVSSLSVITNALSLQQIACKKFFDKSK